MNETKYEFSQAVRYFDREIVNDNDQFAALLPVIIGGVAVKIVAETHVSEDEVFEKLYSTGLYASLENESTKVWTYSVPKLFDLYQGETRTGRLELPEY